MNIGYGPMDLGPGGANFFLSMKIMTLLKSGDESLATWAVGSMYIDSVAIRSMVLHAMGWTPC